MLGSSSRHVNSPLERWYFNMCSERMNMYVNQACHIKTNQVHVGRALADKQEINESTFEIFVRMLLISNHMIFPMQFEI